VIHAGNLQSRWVITVITVVYTQRCT